MKTSTENGKEYGKEQDKQNKYLNKKWNSALRFLLILLLTNGLFWTQARHIAYTAGVNPVAMTVYGQGGSFTSNTADYPSGTPSASNLLVPHVVTLDSSGNLYVAENSSNRVLYYPAGSTTATRVYGQGGNFTTNTANNGGITANSLSGPNGLVVDNSGNLYIADFNNNRVLFYPAGSTTATRVYGQGGNFTTNTTNNGGISTTSLNNPSQLALDSSGNLYVCDTNNNRALYYPAGTITATRVYGQGGSFTTNTVNNGGVSADSLDYPHGMHLDSGDNLYVADALNNRVLYYPAGSTTATRVYGQGSSFTANTANNGGVSANSLNYPGDVMPNNAGNLYVADANNNRMLYYPAGSTTAVRVYGQGNSFTTNAANNGGISTTSLNGVFSLFVDSSGNIYVADAGNNRVLKFQTSLSISTQPPATVTSPFTIAAQLIDVGSGLAFPDFSGTTTLAIKAGTGPTGATLSGTTSVVAASGIATFSGLSINLSGAGYILTASSSGVGSANTNTFNVGLSPAALTVYGQGGSFTTNTANYPSGSVSAISLLIPHAVTLDSSGNLYIAENFNNRVLFYPAGSTTATRVYGQGGSFTASAYNNGGVSANSLWGPEGMAVDASGNLYISDFTNNRVLYYPAGSTTATRVYGQSGSFTTNAGNNGGISATSLSQPSKITLDSSGNLYVCDTSNNRVLYYPAGSTTATQVYGQGGNFTSNSINNGGVSANSLNYPHGIHLDSSGNLYVADAYNNRVLFYPAGSTTATRVYGQSDSFTTNTANNGGISANSLNTPMAMTVDSGNNLYIADASNNRMLYYPAGSTTATRVYGQGNSFTTNSANNGGISATSLSSPFGLSADNSGYIYVADAGNNRVLKFQTSLNVTTQPAASTNAGSSISIATNLIDVGSGLIFTDFSSSVTAAIKSGTGTPGATLGGTTSVSAVSSVATFSNLTINTGGTGYILAASSPGVGTANTNSFAIVGSLLFTPLTSPSFSFTLTGSTGTITAQRTLKVKDTTGSVVGWHMTITSTQFVSGANKLPTSAMTITGVTSACTAGQTCVVPANGVSVYPITVPAATTAPAAISYFSANGNTGTGDVTLTVTFSLSIPPGTASGTYTSTATDTVQNASSYYNIVNNSNGQVADVSGASLSNGGNVISYPTNAGLNQQWQLVDVGGGYDKIIVHHSGKALDVSGSSVADNALIVQNGYTGLTSQQWQLVSVGNNYFKIVNRNSGKVLEATGSTTNLDQLGYTGATSQQWKFVPYP